MGDDGDSKDDVKLPDGEIGDKITKLFKTEEKDTSQFTSYICNSISLTVRRRHCPYCYG